VQTENVQPARLALPPQRPGDDATSPIPGVLPVRPLRVSRQPLPVRPPVSPGINDQSARDFAWTVADTFAKASVDQP
jgi:hypothetical protein